MQYSIISQHFSIVKRFGEKYFDYISEFFTNFSVILHKNAKKSRTGSPFLAGARADSLSFNAVENAWQNYFEDTSP